MNKVSLTFEYENEKIDVTRRNSLLCGIDGNELYEVNFWITGDFTQEGTFYKNQPEKGIKVHSALRIYIKFGQYGYFAVCCRDPEAGYYVYHNRITNSNCSYEEVKYVALNFLKESMRLENAKLFSNENDALNDLA